LSRCPVHRLAETYRKLGVGILDKERGIDPRAQVDCQPAALGFAFIFVRGIIGHPIPNVVSAFLGLEVKVSNVRCGWRWRYYHIVDIIPLVFFNQLAADINLNLHVAPVYCAHNRVVVDDNLMGLPWCYGEGRRSLRGYQGSVSSIKAAFVDLNFCGGRLLLGAGRGHRAGNCDRVSCPDFRWSDRWSCQVKIDHLFRWDSHVEHIIPLALLDQLRVNVNLYLHIAPVNGALDRRVVDNDISALVRLYVEYTAIVISNLGAVSGKGRPLIDNDLGTGINRLLAP